jgi:hypothetical protein
MNHNVLKALFADASAYEFVEAAPRRAPARAARGVTATGLQPAFAPERD